MPGARVENSPKFVDRMRDISSWREGDIRSLSTRAKKKYYRRKSAIEDYFTSNISIDEITLRKHISSERLLQLAEQCLMQAEDGSPWGFRALMPGVNVIDYAAQPAAEAPSSGISGEDTQNLDHETKSDHAVNPPAPEVMDCGQCGKTRPRFGDKPLRAFSEPRASSTTILSNRRRVRQGALR